MRFTTTYFLSAILYLISFQAYSNPHDALLKAAVLAGNSHEVHLQLSLGGNPNQIVDEAGNTLLHHAVQHNFLEISRSLLLGPPADYVAPLPMSTPLPRRSCGIDAGLSPALLEGGASLSGLGALVAIGFHSGTLSGDLDAKAFFGPCGGSGEPDVFASSGGPLATAEAFVGASPLAINANGITPLHYAITNGNVPIVNLLGQNGGGAGVQTLIFSSEDPGATPLAAGFLAALVAALPYVANSLTTLSLSNLQTAIPLEDDDSDSDGDGHIIFPLMNAPEFGTFIQALATHHLPAFTTLELNHLGTITDEHSNHLTALVAFLHHVSPTLQNLSLASNGLHSAELHTLLTLLLSHAEYGLIHFPVLENLNLTNNHWDDDAYLEPVASQLGSFIFHHEQLSVIDFSHNLLPQAFINQLILQIAGYPSEMPENIETLNFSFLDSDPTKSTIKRSCQIHFR